MTAKEKMKKLLALGTKRQRAPNAPDKRYFNLHHFRKGFWDSRFVSPYTKAAHNVNSPIFIVLQDWTSSDGMKAKNADKDEPSRVLGYSPANRTNINLIQLLNKTYDQELKDVFATNLFPFIKRGGRSASIIRKDQNDAFVEYCWPQIEIIQPKLVVCLGKIVFTTFARNLHHKSDRHNVGDFFLRKVNRKTIAIYYQAHTGRWGSNQRGGIKQLLRDWKQMKKNCPP